MMEGSTYRLGDGREREKGEERERVVLVEHARGLERTGKKKEKR